MNTLFTSTIVSIGDLVPDFLKENTVILFNEDAPDELRDIAVLHTKSEQFVSIETGDIFQIGDLHLRVTSVGEKANETLQTIGHCTVKADGSAAPQLPGMIHVEDATLPSLAIGVKVAFFRP